MGTQFARMPHRWRLDRRLASLAPDEHRCWFGLYLLAAEQTEHPGVLFGLGIEVLAVEVSEGDVEVLARTLATLHQLQVISLATVDNAPHLAFLGEFSAERHVKPSDRPERVRERVRQSRGRNAPYQESNAPVSPSNAFVTPCNAVTNALPLPPSPSSPPTTPSPTSPVFPELPPTGVGSPVAVAPVATQSAMKLKPPKSPPTTLAVQEANKHLHKRCDETERAAINGTVPDGDDDALELWIKVLEAWKLAYSNNRSLSGPLDWYRTGGPPPPRSASGGRGVTGAAGVAPPRPRRDFAPDEPVLPEITATPEEEAAAKNAGRMLLPERMRNRPRPAGNAGPVALGATLQSMVGAVGRAS